MRSTLYSNSSTSWRITGLALLSTSLVAVQVMPAYADITNDAEATGAYGASTVTSPQDSAAVPVAPAAPVLTVSKSVATPTDTNSDGIIGAGDTITYTFVVTNNGNVTINDAAPVDTGPTFANINGTNALSAFSPVNADLSPNTGTLASPSPGSSQSFTATYVISTTDANNVAGIPAATGDAIENSATATGIPVRGTLAPVTPSTAETEIPATTGLTIAKSWVFAPISGSLPTGGDVNGNGLADVGDVVIYTYDVENTGNVTVTSVEITDDHEGTVLAQASFIESLVSGTASDASLVLPNPIDGSWDSIGPGAIVRFRYTHTVTQAEVDEG
jgi:uncharacterized repeat protein (TIGR01451 family)